VVEGSGKRLAVECDGDRYHTLDNLDNDLERQALLERLGWTFVRIRGSEFFRDPDRAMLPVFARLNELEIPPEGPGTTDGETPANELELRERVVRRAAELRREWEGSADEPGAPPSAPSFAGEPPGTPEASNPPDPPRPPPAAIQQPLFGPEPTRALPPDIPLPPDPILRAIAVNLGRDWRKCPVCSGRANLVHGSFGPYSDCFQPRRDEPRGGRSPVPTSTINSALSDLRARCPKCGSRLTVPAGELHPTVQCSSRTCRFSINWKSFAQRSDLISP
jgi:hypothetical protein